MMIVIKEHDLAKYSVEKVQDEDEVKAICRRIFYGVDFNARLPRSILA